VVCIPVSAGCIGVILHCAEFVYSIANPPDQKIYLVSGIGSKALFNTLYWLNIFFKVYAEH